MLRLNGSSTVCIQLRCDSEIYIMLSCMSMITVD